MDPRFAAHNLHRDGGLGAFVAGDPQLRRLAQLPLVWRSPLLDRLPTDEPGIYTLGGARQVGKTTLVKQWMARRLEDGADPSSVAYLTAELADDHHVLLRWLAERIEDAPASGPICVAVDEISYVREWDRAIKFLADAGALDRVVLLLTGSDLALLADLRTTLPGRRGEATHVDFLLHPLTWIETARLKKSLDPSEIEVLATAATFEPRALDADGWARCWRALDEYLVHGGFLTALNDVARQGSVRPATLATYGDWIRGDALKRGKSEPYLQETLAAWIKRLGSQVTWNALARDLSIDHPATVADYVRLLERMSALHIVPALDERTLRAAPKKARKLVPADPFVVHAVRHWLEPSDDPTRETIRPFLDDPARAGALVECIVIEHALRSRPAYYLKLTQGEIDLAVVRDRRVHALEVKWRWPIRPEDLKLISRRPRGLVAARTEAVGDVRGVPIVPLPRVLALLGEGRWPGDEG